MRILIYGLGRSGRAALELCHRQGHPLYFFEKRAQGEDIDAALALGARRIEASAELRSPPRPFELCIAAPGVPIDHPDLVALRAAGIETIGEVEWVYRSVPADIVGVTGTAGKGSTTLWISRCLEATGLDAPAGGNLDPALAGVARPGATLVAELSSFQLERCPTLKPSVAVLLNVGRDHLDRHRTLERYHAAKRALLANLTERETLVYNADDPIVAGWAHACPAARLAFSTRERADAWLDGDEANPTLVLRDEALLSANELRVGGRHQLANALAVALSCDALGLGADEIRRGLATFKGLPSRFVEVGRLGDIRFVDDSIATRELAVLAALEASVGPVVWIGGGVDKGVDFSTLEPWVRAKVDLFIGVGASADRFAAGVADWTATRVCAQASGEDALRCALETALVHLRRLGGRGTVLLAPLAASFDQFEDYAERGRTFARLVADLVGSITDAGSASAGGGGTWIRS